MQTCSIICDMIFIRCLEKMFRTKASEDNRSLEKCVWLDTSQVCWGKQREKIEPDPIKIWKKISLISIPMNPKYNIYIQECLKIF